MLDLRNGNNWLDKALERKYLIVETKICVLKVASALFSGIVPARNPPLVGVLTVPRTIYKMVGKHQPQGNIAAVYFSSTKYKIFTKSVSKIIVEHWIGMNEEGQTLLCKTRENLAI